MTLNVPKKQFYNTLYLKKCFIHRKRKKEKEKKESDDADNDNDNINILSYVITSGKSFFSREKKKKRKKKCRVHKT